MLHFILCSMFSKIKQVNAPQKRCRYVSVILQLLLITFFHFHLISDQGNNFKQGQGKYITAHTHKKKRNPN